MGYRACLGIIRLGDKYTKPRVEAAAERALLCGAISYKSVASMLQRGIDKQAVDSTETPSSTPARHHGNIRGPEYFT